MKRRDFLQSSLGVAALLQSRVLLADGSTASTNLPATTLSGSTVTLRGRDLAELAASMRGHVLVAGQEGYDQARRVWNAMFDKQPAVIARCASPSDVMRAVTFAREHQLLTAVRAGGHSISGKSTCNGGIVIDVSPMQGVRVDPQARVARVDGGALLRHLDRETSAFGLVTTAGTVSHTGAAGLTLGGGLGRVARRFGLACDNLQSVDVVTADGKLLTASDDQNPELFWAVRGGGGNFGVATSFEYRLHRMNPTILGGDIAWPFAQAHDVLRFYAELMATAPDALNTDVLAVWTPSGPVLQMEACWSDDLAKGERVLQPLRSFGKPLYDRIAAMPYLAIQSSGDESNAAGARTYIKSGFLTALSPQVIDTIVEVFSDAGPNGPAIFFQQGGGAIGRTPVGATAFPNRDANYWLMVVQRWSDRAADQTQIAAIRAAWKHMEPLTRGFYVNAIGDDEHARVGANYGTNYPRLQRIKRQYDAGNLFRLNANVLPA
jgi:FAD/FMN-containing dehydrogenase